jgi:dipeptidyl aminopeptidase/acylaminoacyl peptidase
MLLPISAACSRARHFLRSRRAEPNRSVGCIDGDMARRTEGSRCHRSTLALVAAFLLALSACGGPAPAGASAPARSGSIDPRLKDSVLAYASGSAASADIYVSRADGSDRRQLTFGPGIKSYPAWSPDGRRIAYRAEPPDPQPATPDFETTGTLVVALDGSGVVSVTKVSRVLGGVASWSPDGTMLTVGGRHEGDPARAESIWIMNADGSAARRLTPIGTDAQQPSWSPDGQRIAFVVAESSRFTIHIMNADGTNSRRLTTGPRDENPMWSPDSSMIAFWRGAGGDIWLMNPDGSAQRKTDATTGHECGAPATWASSNFIALSCGGTEGGFVAAVRPDGTGYTVLLAGREASFPALGPRSADASP